jgi:hypothetical protein
MTTPLQKIRCRYCGTWIWEVQPECCTCGRINIVRDGFEHPTAPGLGLSPLPAGLADHGDESGLESA